MITNDELKIIQTLLSDLTDKTIEEKKLLNKIEVLIAFDSLQKDYDEKRKVLSDRLQEIEK